MLRRKDVEAGIDRPRHSVLTHCGARDVEGDHAALVERPIKARDGAFWRLAERETEAQHAVGEVKEDRPAAEALREGP